MTTLKLIVIITSLAIACSFIVDITSAHNQDESPQQLSSEPKSKSQLRREQFRLQVESKKTQLTSVPTDNIVLIVIFLIVFFCCGCLTCFDVCISCEMLFMFDAIFFLIADILSFLFRTVLNLLWKYVGQKLVNRAG